MIILGLDPGPVQTGWAFWNTETKRVEACGYSHNEVVAQLVAENDRKADHLAVETPHGFGGQMAVSLRETLWWAGRFVQAWIMGTKLYLSWYSLDYVEIRKVLGNLGQQAKESDVRQVILQRYGACLIYGDHGKGTKKNPGPFYGVSGHMWSATVAAIAAQDKLIEEARQADAQKEAS